MQIKITQECDNGVLDQLDIDEFFTLGNGGTTTVPVPEAEQGSDELALDWFHDSYAIACLDNYTIEVVGWQSLSLDGFEVRLSRDSSGIVTISLDTESVKDSDMFSTGVPKLHLSVNDSDEFLNSDGEFTTLE